MRSFYNFGVLEALPPPARAVLCPPPGDSNPPPIPPRLASSGQPAPPPVCGYSRLAFAPTPAQYPQPIRKAAHGGAVLCALCAALCAVFRACLVWIFPDHSGGCAGAVRRHGGAGKGKRKSRPRRGGSCLIYSFSKAPQGQRTEKR